MPNFNRRTFLRSSGLSALPLLAPAFPAFAGSKQSAPPPTDKMINFFFDGEYYTPANLLPKLQELQATRPIEMDRYGDGGVVQALEKKFTEITGKEKAMFMPSGTMANQLAIRVLSGENAKVFVQETSHVYRDEADAAQTVHNKRLIPLAQGEAGFTVEQLQQAVDYHQQGEVFVSGIGAISIENPVRRADGKFIPIAELKKISEYCKKQGYKMHLDGARLPLAAAWSGNSIAEYAALFDTVYISLYKCLGAPAGAMLCGDKAVIDKMGHLVKIFGGSMYHNWANAAIALYHLEGLETRLQQTRQRAEEVFAALNKMPQLKISAIPNGTNIYELQYAKGVNGVQVNATLAKDHNIRIARPDEKGFTHLFVNETILYRDAGALVTAFKNSLMS